MNTQFEYDTKRIIVVLRDMLFNSRYLDAQRANIKPGRIAAMIKGGPLAPSINGTVSFMSVPGGTEVTAMIYGLPPYRPAINGQGPIGPFGFHIHENGSCDIGDPNLPFEAAGGHWNPTNQPHGNHAGDFPVLFSNRGYSKMTFFTSKFKPDDVIGKTIIIHQNPDDYRTQPAGDAGKRLACGIIEYIKEG